MGVVVGSEGSAGDFELFDLADFLFEGGEAIVHAESEVG